MILLQVRDAIPPIESVTASSYMGWGASLFALGTFAIFIWDRMIGKGKSLAAIEGKIDKLCGQVDDILETQRIMDGHLDTLSREVQSLTSEWKGFDGMNGARSVLKDHTRQIALILERNIRLDAVRERDRERSGGQHRREIDRVLDEGEGREEA